MANSNSTPTIYTTTTAAPYMPGTPEELLIVHPGVERKLHNDALSCCLLRASAIVTLLLSDGKSEKGFDSSHHVVMNGLLALD